MFYSTMWASCGGGFGGRPLGQEVMWRAYLNGFLSVDLENMPEDADMDHVGMRSPISPSHPPLPPLPPSSCTDITPTGSKITSNPINEEAPDSKSDDDEDDQHHQKMTNGSEYGGDHSSSTPPPALSPRHHHAPSYPQVNGVSKKRLCGGEDEKIKEYLMRSDTAVIYPEPVGGVSKGSESESMQTNIHPEQPSVTEKPKARGEYLLLKCPHCDQSFSGPQAIHELKDHLSSVHKELPLSSSPVPRASAEPNLVCNKCNATFTCKENLAKHKLFHVSNGQSSMLNADESATLRKFKCPECGKAFKFKHHLKEHIRIHSGEKPFACANCGKRFSHSGSYSSHMTSKKCLVVNLKVRKVDTRSSRGRGSSQNNSFRPIIPKYGSNSGTSSSNGNSSAGASELPLIPAGYMPSSERFPHFMVPGRPQQPYMPLSFHPVLANAPHYLPLGAFPDVSQLLQNRLEKECSIASEHSSHPQPIPQLPPSSSADKSEENVDTSQAKPGELNAVKKILEIVDATVTKQQQGQQTPQSSPKVRNGLLSELLSAAPQASVKIPTGGDVESRDSRCRFCCRLFDSKIDLHQHERYLCPHNIELRGSKPFLIDHQQDHSDGESSKDSGEEIQPRSSTSILNDDSLQTLRAHYQINPRPKKSEVIRLSRDLKCSTRAVQAWFHSQQHLSRDLQMNGEAPRSPPALHQTTPFTNIISQYNGALPTSAASIASQHHNMQDHLPIIDSAKGIPHLRYGQQNLDNDQPLDLSVKVKREDSSSCHSSPVPAESEVLNLSQRSSRTATPPKENSSYHLSQHPQIHQQSVYFESDKGSPPLHPHLQTSLLYKYMQIGLSGASVSPQSGNSPMHPPLAAVTPTSPGRSPPHAEAPQGLPSPDAASRADNSSSPGGTIGSYGPLDEHGDVDPSSPTSGKKMRLWHQGEGDESTLDDSPGHEEDSSGGSGKMRKSWKLHKVESEEGMYACDQCDKMFSKQSSLARHKYEHSGQRPHKCDVCNKAFKHKHHLTEHKRLHSGEKPFQCNKCLKRFSHSGSYSQHMNHRYSYCKPYHE